LAAKSGNALVIVESPTKAKTISKFLPQGFVVEASVGHVRDLPTSAKEIPAAKKGEPWSRLGIDIEHDFEPLYIVPAAKKKQVQKLKELLKDASEVYLATDEDREGESISWHLVEVLAPRVPMKRLVFHEITKSAIQKALEQPRELDRGLVEAQETRRILDRLYGYEVSPILWRKIGPGLSAGRVQSVAVRLIVERERERQRFVRATYWDLDGTFRAANGSFEASLVSVGGRRVASGRDFDPSTGRLRGGSDAVWLDAAASEQLRSDLERAAWSISKLERKPYTERPAPPFTTSTLQQESNRKLRLSARATMQAAQRLYENGLITYMRTDSTSLSSEAVGVARRRIEELYGAEYLPAAPRTYQTKVKNAQEAHEAIRPAGEFLAPDAVRGQLGSDESRLYELIWKRTMACQMADSRGHRLTLEVSGGQAVFQASGKSIEFPGFLRAYVEGADDPDAELADKEVVLPAVRQGEAVRAEALAAIEHTTQPPARFTEASLVKELEANGVGRPSTYASIIDTILRREYVVKQKNALQPTFMAFAVVGLLERYFTHLVDVDFTARMEDDLDAISLGQKQSLPYLRHFYYGVGGAPDGANGASAAARGSDQGLKRLLAQEIDPREACTLPLGVDDAGQGIDIRIGRFGPYLQRGEERASIPEGLAPDELDLPKALELLARGSGPTELGVDPETGRQVYLKAGRFGPYVQLGENDEEPKMKSLLPGWVPEEVTLDAALRLLRLPREVGLDPATQEPVLADFGRYGPYLRRGSDTRSLEDADQIFAIGLDRALEILAQEKKSSFRRGPKVLRELGAAPAGEPVKLLEGRYGPYVTDGTTNASLAKGADPAALTLEEALELLRARAAAGPRSKKKTAKKAAKKASKKASKRGATSADAEDPAAVPPADGTAPNGRKVAKKAGKRVAKKARRSARAAPAADEGAED
jgi:DNA topoisomerase-1